MSRRFRSAPTRRDCPTGKAGFRSEAAAIWTAQTIHQRVHAYVCWACHDWHLTRQTPQQSFDQYARRVRRRQLARRAHLHDD